MYLAIGNYTLFHYKIPFLYFILYSGIIFLLSSILLLNTSLGCGLVRLSEAQLTKLTSVWNSNSIHHLLITQMIKSLHKANNEIFSIAGVVIFVSLYFLTYILKISSLLP